MAGRHIPLSLVHDHPKNPRRDYGKADEIAESVEEAGLREPVELMQCSCNSIKGDHFVIVEGHTRVRALRKLGWRKLSPSHYSIRNFTEDEALLHMYLVNEERSNYSPVERYAILSELRKRRHLKATAKEMGWSYGSAKRFLSLVDRLAPKIREHIFSQEQYQKVRPSNLSSRTAADQTAMSESKRSDRTTFPAKSPSNQRYHDRFMRELVKVHFPDQEALFDANLTLPQLREAVKKIKKEQKPVEEAIAEVRAGTVIASADDAVSASFTSAFVMLVRGAVNSPMLCGFGYTPSTAKRVLRKLEGGGFLYKGTLSPGFEEIVRAYLESVPRSEISSAYWIARTLGMGDWSREQVDGFVRRIRELTSPRTVKSTPTDMG